MNRCRILPASAVVLLGASAHRQPPFAPVSPPDVMHATEGLYEGTERSFLLLQYWHFPSRSSNHPSGDVTGIFSSPLGGQEDVKGILAVGWSQSIVRREQHRKWQQFSPVNGWSCTGGCSWRNLACCRREIPTREAAPFLRPS